LGILKSVTGKKMNEEDWQMRKLAATLLALVLLVLGAVPAFGAVDQSKVKEIKPLTQQMNSIKAQIIDKEVEAGILDQTKADKIKNAMQERQQKIEQDIDNGEFKGLGHKKGCCGKHSNASPAPQKAE
jgi:predicted PurR-regulated permease PerM